jgi:DNA-binding MarR family transcriptional regulator
MVIIMTGRQYQILIQLRAGPWRTSELAEEFEMQKTNVSRDVRELRHLDFVETEKDPNDERLKYHHITTVGREHLEREFPRD